MNLANILKGTKIAYDAIQSIQGLTIVPLTCEAELSLDDKYASPFAHNVSTSSYGTVHLNPTPGEKRTVLVTPHSVYITKGYSAQDHLISKAALLKRQAKILSDSRCVESSQGGLIKTTGNNQMVVAPLKLREVALNYVGQSGYNKLWESIGKFNREHNAGSAQQIKDYFKKWDKQLDEFIAHFERLDNCIGFITLYQDEVVAIDKFPSFSYTSEIWERLVRDSYAALVIRDRVAKNSAGTSLSTVDDMDKRMTVENIYKALVKDRKDHYKMIMQEVVDITFNTKPDSDTAGSQIVESTGYIGQVIDDNGINVMVSIIKKDQFNPSDMRAARVMRSKARKQQDFTL